MGRFVGISEDVGHAMTYKILTPDKKVICRSVICTALKKGGFDNLQARKEAKEAEEESDTKEVHVREQFVKAMQGDILRSARDDQRRCTITDI